MRRLRRPSSMTIYVAIWPLPLTSFHASFAAEPQTWQVCCGGYCSLPQPLQCCNIRRFALTASQNGLLTSSATGISFGILLLHEQSDIHYGRPMSLPCHGVCASITDVVQNMRGE